MSRISIFMESCNGKFPNENSMLSVSFIKNILNDEEDENIVIERRKKFNVKPMSSEEAILQMELVGHNFYMFRNQDNFEINIVYKRKAGGYGLIEQD